MLVRDIFKSCNFENVFNYTVDKDDNYGMYSNYEKEKLFIKIKNLFQECLSLKRLEDEEYNNFIVFIAKAYDDFVNVHTLSEYYDVFGIYFSDIINNKEYLETLNPENKITSYGLDFIPRNILMYLEVAKSSIDAYGLDVCTAEIFKEMTFYGFDEGIVIKEKNNLLKQISEINQNHSAIMDSDDFAKNTVEIKDEETIIHDSCEVIEKNNKIRNELFKNFLRDKKI